MFASNQHLKNYWLWTCLFLIWLLSVPMAHATSPYLYGTQVNSPLSQYQDENYQAAMHSYDQIIAAIEAKYAFERDYFEKCKASGSSLCMPLRVEPSHADAYYGRALARKNLGDHFGAIEDLKKAASIYQQLGNVRAYSLVASLLQRYR